MIGSSLLVSAAIRKRGLFPIPPLSHTFLDSLDDVSDTARKNGLHVYWLVYISSSGRICAREDQILVAVHLQQGRDSVKLARTGSGKTLQIIMAALSNPKGSMVLVMSPLKRLQTAMIRNI